MHRQAIKRLADFGRLQQLAQATDMVVLFGLPPGNPVSLVGRRRSSRFEAARHTIVVRNAGDQPAIIYESSTHRYPGPRIVRRIVDIGVFVRCPQGYDEP